MSKTKSKSSTTTDSSSNPLSPDEVGGYFDRLNTYTKGGLNKFAVGGSAPVTYKGPTDGQIARLGGLGATQKLDINRAQDDAMARLGADPSLSVFQRLRGQQLTGQDALQQTQALDKETEAAITQLVNDRAAKTTETGFRNNDQRRDDLATIAEIFFGGKGDRSSSKTVGKSKEKGSIIDDIAKVAGIAAVV